MHQWTLDEDAAAPFFRQAVELGVTFWDTANVYQGGTSEEFVGRAITRFSRREDIVLATKVSGKMHDGPGGSGLSRKAILEQVDASLRRLGTDYIDVYYIHRYDPDAPVEEIMATLDALVSVGKVRYLGASSMWAWQFAKMQHAAQLHGWTRFSAMQDQYNVLKREEERDMIPLCLDQGVGLTPYSPLAKGRAARPWGEQTARPPPTLWPRRSTGTWTSPWSTPSIRSLRIVASRWPRSPWRGCCRSRSCAARSSVPPSPGTCRMPSRRWS
jgi:aryl-alcohol dehydrogenase-like predicted oxidoreductase